MPAIYSPIVRQGRPTKAASSLQLYNNNKSNEMLDLKKLSFVSSIACMIMCFGGNFAYCLCILVVLCVVCNIRVMISNVFLLLLLYCSVRFLCGVVLSVVVA